MKTKKNSKSNSSSPQRKTISSVVERKLIGGGSINPNIYYLIALYFILILDSITKLEIEIRNALNHQGYLVYIVQISVYSSLMFFSGLLEICYKSKNLQFSSYVNDGFYFFSSLIVSICILEEILASSQLNNAILIEGCKITIIQFILMPNFTNEKPILFTYIMNIIYIVARLHQSITENIIIYFALFSLLAIQIIKRKVLTGSGKFYRDNRNSMRKNITTYMEENEFESSDFNYLFENLLNNASDGFILFDNQMEIIFHNQAITKLFPEMSSDLKNGLLSLRLQDLDADLLKALEVNRPKTKKLLDLQNIFQLKLNSNVLSSISSYEEGTSSPRQINLKIILEVLNLNRFSTFRASLSKLTKVKDYKFGFKTSNYNENNPYNLCVGGVSVFCYRSKKIFLICFKKEMLANKILDNFNKVIDYISVELTSSLNTSLIMLQMLQTSTIIPKKLINDFVNPALTSTKFLINLKNEMANICGLLKGKIVKNLIEFNLKDLAMEVLSMFNFQCESKEIQLSLKYDERIPKIITSDPRLITQILTTLISI